jgi:hypothetical protein
VSEAQDWIKALYTYGPFGLIVLFLFVGEAKARHNWTTSRTNERALAAVIYACNWAAIFALLGFAVYAWNRIHLPGEASIRGKLGTLEANEQVTSETQNLYLRRVYGARKGYFSYEWRLVSDSRLPEGTKVLFTLDRSTQDSEWVRDYELVVDPRFYDSYVVLQYDRKNDKLVLKMDGKEVPLQRVSAPPPRKRPTSLALISNAYAGDPFPEANYVKRLESGDAILRRDARSDLAKQGTEGLPWMKKALADPKTSYRVRLGIILALDQMPGLKLESLGPQAVLSLIDASVDRDESMRAEARRLLRHKATWELEGFLRQAIVEARAQPGGAQRTAELARTGLDLLYNLGVYEKDRYGSTKAEDRQRLDKAILAFDRAWALREYANPADRAQFAKALYGWGLALHARSWIERKAGGARDELLVRAAQDKFTQFIQEATRPNTGAYPLPVHIKQAEGYIKNPSPENFKT